MDTGFTFGFVWDGTMVGGVGKRASPEFVDGGVTWLFNWNRIKIPIIHTIPIIMSMSAAYSSMTISVINHFLITSLGKFREMIAHKEEISLIVKSIFLEGVS